MSGTEYRVRPGLTAGGSRIPTVGSQQRQRRGTDHASARRLDDRFRRVSPVAVRPGEGPLTERTAGVRPVRREQVLMPQSGPSAPPPGLAREGGLPSFAATAPTTRVRPLRPFAGPGSIALGRGSTVAND